MRGSFSESLGGSEFCIKCGLGECLCALEKRRRTESLSSPPAKRPRLVSCLDEASKRAVEDETPSVCTALRGAVAKSVGYAMGELRWTCDQQRQSTNAQPGKGLSSRFRCASDGFLSRHPPSHFELPVQECAFSRVSESSCFPEDCTTGVAAGPLRFYQGALDAALEALPKDLASLQALYALSLKHLQTAQARVQTARATLDDRFRILSEFLKALLALLKRSPWPEGSRNLAYGRHCFETCVSLRAASLGARLTGAFAEGEGFGCLRRRASTPAAVNACSLFSSCASFKTGHREGPLSELTCAGAGESPGVASRLAEGARFLRRKGERTRRRWVRLVQVQGVAKMLNLRVKDALPSAQTPRRSSLDSGGNCAGGEAQTLDRANLLKALLQATPSSTTLKIATCFDLSSPASCARRGKETLFLVGCLLTTLRGDILLCDVSACRRLAALPSDSVTFKEEWMPVHRTSLENAAADSRKGGGQTEEIAIPAVRCALKGVFNNSEFLSLREKTVRQPPLDPPASALGRPQEQEIAEIAPAGHFFKLAFACFPRWSRSTPARKLRRSPQAGDDRGASFTPLAPKTIRGVFAGGGVSVRVRLEVGEGAVRCDAGSAALLPVDAFYGDALDGSSFSSEFGESPAPSVARSKRTAKSLAPHGFLSASRCVIGESQKGVSEAKPEKAHEASKEKGKEDCADAASLGTEQTKRWIAYGRVAQVSADWSGCGAGQAAVYVHLENVHFLPLDEVPDISSSTHEKQGVPLPERKTRPFGGSSTSILCFRGSSALRVRSVLTPGRIACAAGLRFLGMEECTDRRPSASLLRESRIENSRHAALDRFLVPNGKETFVNSDYSAVRVLADEDAVISQWTAGEFPAVFTLVREQLLARKSSGSLLNSEAAETAQASPLELADARSPWLVPLAQSFSFGCLDSPSSRESVAVPLQSPGPLWQVLLSHVLANSSGFGKSVLIRPSQPRLAEDGVVDWRSGVEFVGEVKESLGCAVRTVAHGLLQWVSFPPSESLAFDSLRVLPRRRVLLAKHRLVCRDVGGGASALSWILASSEEDGDEVKPNEASPPVQGWPGSAEGAARFAESRRAQVLTQLFEAGGLLPVALVSAPDSDWFDEDDSGEVRGEAESRTNSPDARAWRAKAAPAVPLSVCEEMLLCCESGKCGKKEARPAGTDLSRRDLKGVDLKGVESVALSEAPKQTETGAGKRASRDLQLGDEDVPCEGPLWTLEKERLQRPAVSAFCWRHLCAFLELRQKFPPRWVADVFGAKIHPLLPAADRARSVQTLAARESSCFVAALVCLVADACQRTWQHPQTVGEGEGCVGRKTNSSSFENCCECGGQFEKCLDSTNPLERQTASSPLPSSLRLRSSASFCLLLDLWKLILSLVQQTGVASALEFDGWKEKEKGKCDFKDAKHVASGKRAFGSRHEEDSGCSCLRESLKTIFLNAVRSASCILTQHRHASFRGGTTEGGPSLTLEFFRTKETTQRGLCADSLRWLLVVHWRERVLRRLNPRDGKALCASQIEFPETLSESAAFSHPSDCEAHNPWSLEGLSQGGRQFSLASEGSLPSLQQQLSQDSAGEGVFLPRIFAETQLPAERRGVSLNAFSPPLIGSSPLNRWSVYGGAFAEKEHKSQGEENNTAALGEGAAAAGAFVVTSAPLSQKPRPLCFSALALNSLFNNALLEAPDVAGLWGFLHKAFLNSKTADLDCNSQTSSEAEPIWCLCENLFFFSDVSGTSLLLVSKSSREEASGPIRPALGLVKPVLKNLQSGAPAVLQSCNFSAVCASLERASLFFRVTFDADPALSRLRKALSLERKSLLVQEERNSSPSGGEPRQKEEDAFELHRCRRSPCNPSGKATPSAARVASCLAAESALNAELAFLAVEEHQLSPTHAFSDGAGNDLPVTTSAEFASRILRLAKASPFALAGGSFFFHVRCKTCVRVRKLRPEKTRLSHGAAEEAAWVCLVQGRIFAAKALAERSREGTCTSSSRDGQGRRPCAEKRSDAATLSPSEIHRKEEVTLRVLPEEFVLLTSNATYAVAPLEGRAVCTRRQAALEDLLWRHDLPSPGSFSFETAERISEKLLSRGWCVGELGFSTGSQTPTPSLKGDGLLLPPLGRFLFARVQEERRDPSCAEKMESELGGASALKEDLRAGRLSECRVASALQMCFLLADHVCSEKTLCREEAPAQCMQCAASLARWREEAFQECRNCWGCVVRSVEEVMALARSQLLRAAGSSSRRFSREVLCFPPHCRGRVCVQKATVADLYRLKLPTGLDADTSEWTVCRLVLRSPSGDGEGRESFLFQNGGFVDVWSPAGVCAGRFDFLQIGMTVSLGPLILHVFAPTISRKATPETTFSPSSASRRKSEKPNAEKGPAAREARVPCRSYAPSACDLAGRGSVVWVAHRFRVWKTSLRLFSRERRCVSCRRNRVSEERASEGEAAAQILSSTVRALLPGVCFHFKRSEEPPADASEEKPGKPKVGGQGQNCAAARRVLSAWERRAFFFQVQLEATAATEVECLGFETPAADSVAFPFRKTFFSAASEAEAPAGSSYALSPGSLPLALRRFARARRGAKEKRLSAAATERSAQGNSESGVRSSRLQRLSLQLPLRPLSAPSRITKTPSSDAWFSHRAAELFLANASETFLLGGWVRAVLAVHARLTCLQCLDVEGESLSTASCACGAVKWTRLKRQSFKEDPVGIEFSVLCALEELSEGGVWPALFQNREALRLLQKMQWISADETEVALDGISAIFLEQRKETSAVAECGELSRLLFDWAHCAECTDTQNASGWMSARVGGLSTASRERFGLIAECMLRPVHYEDCKVLPVCSALSWREASASELLGSLLAGFAKTKTIPS